MNLGSEAYLNDFVFGTLKDIERIKKLFVVSLEDIAEIPGLIKSHPMGDGIPFLFGVYLVSSTCN